jgi:serine/threonine protein phosphatase PrpC
VPVVAAAGSDPGRERENNEDRVLCDPDRGIYAVIDGVGGESGGEVAAGIAHDTLHARLSRRTTDLERLIREAIALANREIYQRAEADHRLRGMACVLTVALLDEDRARVGHVGDSRLYHLRAGAIRKVTPDHSPVGSREDSGEISEIEAMRHPRRNEIFRDVGSALHGPDDEGFIDVLEVPFDDQSALLFCSDGLSDMVTSAAIREAVEAHPGDPEAAVEELIERANQAGGKDNISVVLVMGERFGAARPPKAKRTAASRPAAPAWPEPAPARPASAATRATPVQGAAYARSSGRRWAETLFSGPALFLYTLLVLALCAWIFRDRLPWKLPWQTEDGGATGAPPSAVLQVGPGNGAFPSIADALDAAQPGQTVEVAPGEYSGRVQLREGVNLVSATPRGAVLLPSPGGGPVVDARQVRGARLSGFLIQAASENPYTVGLRLSGSAVEVENVEITGAPSAGIEIAGGDRSVLRFNDIHGNPGAGVRILEGSVPQLVQNAIHGNGKSGAAPQPGVEIGFGSRPQLIENRIEENNAAKGPQVLVLNATPDPQAQTRGQTQGQTAAPAPPKPGTADLIAEIARRNSFGTQPAAQAVRGPDPAAPAKPARPARGSRSSRNR